MLTNVRECKKCGAGIPNFVFIGDKRQRLYNRQYCLHCSPINSHLKITQAVNHTIFDKVDTKQKAYWLGFLYADGSTASGRISIYQAKKDASLLYGFANFIGLDTGRIRERHSYPNQMHLQVGCKKLVEALQTLGVVPHKENSMRLPSLGSKELDLAFLLGFYDGDGTAGSCTVACGNSGFLVDIKSRFGLSNKISYRKNEWGSSFELGVGRELFRDMLANYAGSLPRKRFIKNDKKPPQEWKKRKKKFDPTREELGALVWEMSLVKVGRHFGVSGNAVKKRCTNLGIERPPVGHWAKKG